MTRRPLLSLVSAVLLATAVTAAPPSTSPAAGGKGSADAFWDAVASYADVRAEADAQFARAAADAVAKRDAALDRAYAAYGKDRSRPAYDRWVAEAQDALARRLSPAADAWMARMREYCARTADVAVALQGGGPGQDKLFDRARVGFVHRWSVDSAAFDRRLRDVTAFRPTEPAAVEALRAARPGAFPGGDAGPATRPAAATATVDRPVDVTLWILDDDKAFGPALYINGRDDTFFRGEVRRVAMSSFLTRYEFRLLPTDVLTVGTTDRKTGVVAYLMTDRAGRLVAYSRPGLPASGTAKAYELEQTSQPIGPTWEAAVRVPGKDLRPLRAAASVPGSLPGDFGGIWVPSSRTGRCTVLAYPPLPPPG